MSNTFDQATVARILALIQSGESVCVASVGGKWTKTLCYRDDQFCFAIFDEGSNYEEPASQQAIRLALEATPDAFRELLARSD
ncbi:MAG TPA: hypothetical protein PLF40_19035 [Kofleriaceae bacterium]|nr:hypothetical protein [Kofleriaceae bacterium]